ncbi:MAG: hypothetical protein IPK23_05270 [Rhizobiales bacterium]|nr:hypothetical protein [Hyphomicrobiales bacterium]
MRRDISLGYLSAGEALRRYGVAISKDGTVDPELTRKKRDEIKSSRVLLPLQLVNTELLDGFRRLFELPRAAADRLAVDEGALVEIVTGRNAAMRGWVRIVDGANNVLRVDAATLTLLAAEAGAPVEVRPIRAVTH